MTGSWDRTLRYWDLRQPDPVQVVKLPERVYAFSVSQQLLVLGLANRQVQVRRCCKSLIISCERVCSKNESIQRLERCCGKAEAHDRFSQALICYLLERAPKLTSML